jgi:hypothetical protein
MVAVRCACGAAVYGGVSVVLLVLAPSFKLLF